MQDPTLNPCTERIGFPFAHHTVGSALTRSQLTSYTPFISVTRSHNLQTFLMFTLWDLTPAIRFFTAKVSNSSYPATVQLLCHVKPGVSANRQGIASVSDHVIEVCVAAQAKNGEANKAVRKVIADALRVPKSDVDVIKGMESREKTVSINVTLAKDSPTTIVECIKAQLIESVSG
jgi:uncharacterized protein YggU (UPF0235/DUF167 family)